MKNRHKKNNYTALVLVAVMFGMCLITAAAVPLYRLFCQKLGIPVPTIQVGEQAAGISTAPISNRTVVIRFTANAGAGVPVRFNPLSYSITARLGEPILTAYDAFNTSPIPLDGVAVHMLYAMGGPSNFDVSQYVQLQQCFCFELQHYPAQTQIKLPLSFTISPNLPEGVHTITFSYTLFQAMPNDPRIRKTSTTTKP